MRYDSATRPLLLLVVFVLSIASHAAAQIPTPTIYVKGSLFLKGPLTSVTGLIDVQGFEYVGAAPKRGAPVSDFLFRGALTGLGNRVAETANPDGESIQLPTAMSCTPCLGGQQVVVGGGFSVVSLPSIVWKGVTYTTAEWAYSGNSSETLLLYGGVLRLPTNANAATVAFRAPVFLNQWLSLSASPEDVYPIGVVLVGGGTATVQFNVRRNGSGQVEYWFDPSSYSIDVRFDPSNGRPCYDRSCFANHVP
jgi:hypothetical protein